MKAVVVGAGVGGLALARGLCSAGHEVVVCEQAPALRTAGATVTLWSNGTGILRDLGVGLGGLGRTVNMLDTFTDRGQLLYSMRVADLTARFGSPTLVVRRGSLLTRLLEGETSPSVRFAANCVGVREDASGVAALLADGTEIAGDVLIGTDGHNSVVRRHLFADGPAKPTGIASWQGLCDAPDDLLGDHRTRAYIGSAGMCALLPCGDGKLHCLFELPWSPGTEVSIVDLQARFGHLPAPVPALLDALDETELGFYPYVRHRVPRGWGHGRVTLAGDAVHALPATLAQGANQTLEDAWMLARQLARPWPGGDPASLLRGYERARYRPAKLASALSSLKAPYDVLPPRVIGLAGDRLMTNVFAGLLRRFSNYLAEPAPRARAAA
ncbi:FAD-dependent monooxygenase [Amycolatopsis sp. NBC_01488]|uniref:FAD-dependent oxidoreductase n=1 Tax=Amycolatopsis sp. NBC_01488 TaxID=2903563 RepID=UPI002E2B40EA|nr:NAD(P)/FAD-dependent oxidoreductase [Amycolatopsis sp. NBC_01488]